MKKNIPLLAVICFVLAVLWFSNVLLEQQQEQKAEEAYRSEQHLVVYSDMPADVNNALARAFYGDTGMRVQIETRTDEQLQTLVADAASVHGPDLIIASEPILKNLQQAALLQPYTSVTTGTVPASFKDANGYWTGLWYNPMAFVVSRDYYQRRGDQLETWDDLLTDPNLVLAFPDLAATDLAGDFLCSYVEMSGTEASSRYFKALQTHVASYAKSMTPIVRRVAAGEADVGVADAATARQYLNDKAPIIVLYPENGTSYWLYGSGITKWCSDKNLSYLFTDWLLSRSVLGVLHEQHLFLTSASDVLPKELDGRNMYPVLFPVRKLYTDQGRRNIQDWWIKTIRFGKEP